MPGWGQLPSPDLQVLHCTPVCLPSATSPEAASFPEPKLDDRVPRIRTCSVVLDQEVFQSIGAVEMFAQFEWEPDIGAHLNIVKNMRNYCSKFKLFQVIRKMCITI